MKKISKLIQNVDQFGVHYIPTIEGEKSQFKTLFGGFISIFIYAASFCYSLYVIILWGTG